MSGAFGYNESGNQQQQESTTGISRQYRDALSQDAFDQSRLSRDMSTQFARSPFGYFQNQDIRTLIPQNEYGLPVQTTQALQALGNQWFSKASAGGAMRGQVTPENTNQIVGSSMLNASQFLTPYILQNQQYLAELPDRLATQRMGYLQADQDSRARLLGGTSNGQGSGYGFGVSVQGGMGKP